MLLDKETFPIFPEGLLYTLFKHWKFSFFGVFLSVTFPCTIWRSVLRKTAHLWHTAVLAGSHFFIQCPSCTECSTHASLSTACKYQGRLEGSDLPQPITGATRKFHVLWNKQHNVLLLQLLGQMSQMLEQFCCGSPPPFSIGKLDLQLFIAPCCGFLAAFLNHELVRFFYTAAEKPI